MASGGSCNIYESIYYLKKMFPKFEIDVIESVLKANDNSIDLTLDQLLALSIDDDIPSEIDEKNEQRKSSSNQLEASLYIFNNDLPPSYNDIILKAKGGRCVQKDETILNKLNLVLIGELPRDFLRIKLTSEQLKAVKKTDEYKEKVKTKKNKSKVSR